MAADAEPGRAFVLGLDGVPWDLLREWAEEGALENFATLFEEGAAAPLESTTPATTPLAWPSIATGTRPDKHGIYGFRNLTAAHTHEVNTAGDLARPPLWELLAPAVVGNVPMTYPATEVDGAMVTGMMTPDRDAGFTHPPELRAEIDARIPEYEVGLDWNEYRDSTGEFLADLEALVERRRELMRLLLGWEDWRLFFFVYTAPDRLQHLVWEEAVLLEHYRFLDDVLGEVMDHAADREATLFVVSDHGFGPVSTEVAVNRLLAEEGLLRPRRDGGVRGALARLGVTKDAVTAALGAVGLDVRALFERLPQSLAAQVATRVPGDRMMYDVDYAETAAFVHELGTVYVNDDRRFEDGAVDPAAVPAVKRDLRAVLSGLTDPETGESVLAVHDGEELFPTDPRSPDLVVEPADGYEVTPVLAGDALVDAGSKAGAHRSEGVFFAWGSDVEAGTRPADATVYDVAPTLLHAVGEPVPADADGRVLDVFAPGTRPARESPRTRSYARTRTGRDAGDDFGDVEDRLRGLGYTN